MTVRCRKYRAQALVDSVNQVRKAARLDVVLACRPCFVKAKHMGAKERKPSPRGRNSIPGQVEARLERAAAVWRRRCQGTSMPTLAREFNISLSTVHGYIEEQRALLRTRAIDLAAQERDQALELLDNAIEKISPAHQWGDRQSERDRRPKGPASITVEKWQARIQACWCPDQTARSQGETPGHGHASQD